MYDMLVSCCIYFISSVSVLIFYRELTPLFYLLFTGNLLPYSTVYLLQGTYFIILLTFYRELTPLFYSLSFTGNLLHYSTYCLQGTYFIILLTVYRELTPLFYLLFTGNLLPYSTYCLQGSYSASRTLRCLIQLCSRHSHLLVH